VADWGRLTIYGGYWGNKILRVDQNQHHCLVEKWGGCKGWGRNPDRKTACSEA